MIATKLIRGLLKVGSPALQAGLNKSGPRGNTFPQEGRPPTNLTQPKRFLLEGPWQGPNPLRSFSQNPIWRVQTAPPARTDFGAFPVAVRPKSGPEGRYTARKHYCVTYSNAVKTVFRFFVGGIGPQIVDFGPPPGPIQPRGGLGPSSAGNRPKTKQKLQL